MTKLEWNRPQDQTFEAGLDRGVIYTETGLAVPWSGLSSVDDDGETTLEEMYLDGVKYLAHVSPREYKGKLTAYTFPDEFGELVGIAELGDGFYADGQAPGRFNLSYRTMVSRPAVDKKQNYKIHLVYKVMASMGGFSSETIGDGATDPTAFEFELAAVPIQVPGYRPTAHFILDTSKMDDATIATLEGIIYGTAFQEPAMPTIEQLTDLLTYAGNVTVVYNNDGTWTATGSNANIKLLDEKGHFQINNVAAEYLSADVYLLSDGQVVGRIGIVTDTDDVPFITPTNGLTNIGIDTDGVPYFEVGANGAVIEEDTDGVPFYRTN